MNWTEDDDKMLSSIETELLTLIDAYQFELEEIPSTNEDEKKNLINGINFKYKQIDWLKEIKERLYEI